METQAHTGKKKIENQKSLDFINKILSLNLRLRCQILLKAILKMTI